MYVCLCKGLTEADVEQVALRCTPTAEELLSALGLDDDYCCGRCVEAADELLHYALRARERSTVPTPAPQPLV
jgi:bacterioferritin-associated ferredoxin